jgi:hypothetical protein
MCILVTPALLKFTSTKTRMSCERTCCTRVFKTVCVCVFVCGEGVGEMLRLCVARGKVPNHVMWKASIPKARP